MPLQQLYVLKKKGIRHNLSYVNKKTFIYEENKLLFFIKEGEVLSTSPKLDRGQAEKVLYYPLRKDFKM